MIREARLDLGTYLLSELDTTKLNGVYAGDRLKRFFQREGIDLDAAEDAAGNGVEEDVVEEEGEEETDNEQDD